MNKQNPKVYMISTDQVCDDVLKQIHNENYDVVIIHPKDYESLQNLREGAIKKFLEMQEIASYKLLPQPVATKSPYEFPRRKRPRIQK